MNGDRCGLPGCTGSKRCEEPGCEVLHPNACGSDSTVKGWRCWKHSVDVPTTDAGIAELVRAMGARLGAALRMVDELQAEGTKLLEERRAAVARAEELQASCDSFHLGTCYADEPCAECAAARARRGDVSQ